MKYRFTILVCCIASLSLSGSNTKPVNPIIGDQSFLMAFGTLPNDQTDDQRRIRTHVAYAEFLLRTADVSGMSEEQKTRREQTLDLLHEYWTRGSFPRNDDYNNKRKPCFIDREGTICAVGYLVEKTAGLDVAALINERFMYNEILEMNDPMVLGWIASSGLTQKECAIIQPSYGPRYTHSWWVSYGASNRVNDQVYHTFQLYLQKSQNYGKVRSVAGVKFDWLNDGNFSAGIRYGATILSSRRRGKTVPLLALMPECFRYAKKWGMNLKPELELTRAWKWVNFGLSYSYAIPVVSENDYGAGRHDFSLRMAINLNEVRIPKVRNPKEVPVTLGA